MRAFLLSLALGVAGTALLPATSAHAWYDHWGRWHPGFYRRPVVVLPPPIVERPPVVYAPVYPRRAAFWVRPHYNRFGQFIPGHWG